MNKWIFFIIILSTLSSSIISANDTDKKRLAVLPFSSSGNIDKATLDVMFENFTIVMVNAGIYSIIERAQLDKALNELKFQRGDIFDDSSAAELGKMAGAQIVIFGSVNYAGDTYYVNVRGVDVATGVVSFGRREETKNKNDLVKMVDKLAVAISFGDTESTAALQAKSSKLGSTSGNFSIKDQIFVEKYYEGKWNISTDDYAGSRLKFRIFNGVGIGLVVGGSTLFLVGLIPILVTAYYREHTHIVVYEPDPDKRDDSYREKAEVAKIADISFWFVGLPVGISLMAIGALIISLCSIPFLFANRVRTIYRKAAGEKLSFLERAKFDIRIVETKESLTDELNRKVSFGLTISL
jgi:TolB-like protein